MGIEITNEPCTWNGAVAKQASASASIPRAPVGGLGPASDTREAAPPTDRTPSRGIDGAADDSTVLLHGRRYRRVAWDEYRMKQLEEQWAEAAEKASPAMEREVETRPRSQVGQEAVLRALRELGPSNINRLVGALGEAHNTIRWWLGRLEKEGMVKSVRTPRKGHPMLMWEATEGGSDGR